MTQTKNCPAGNIDRHETRGKAFYCSPNTVRKWLNRFDGKLSSLEGKSAATIRRPNELSVQAEGEILKAKGALPIWGAAGSKRDMALPYSEKAIRRVLKE